MQKIKILLSSQKYKYVASIFESLASKPYAIIKGEPLSLFAYGEFGKRHMGDIDLLISRKDLYYLENLLLEDGFQATLQSRKDKIMMLSSAHQISPYIKEIPPYKNVILDINFDIFWGEYEGKRIDIDEFLSDTIELDIFGYKTKTLIPLKAMVQLILHLYKDMNSLYMLATRGVYSVIALKDVYYLLKRNVNVLSVDNLYNISEQYDIISYVYYVLYYVSVIIKDPFLDVYIKAFKTKKGEYLLNCYGLNDSERHEWKVDILTRFKSDNVYELIKDDLTDKDKRKIEINRKVF